jgi:tetratricopeptide (TPR) repeat protein
MAMKKNVFLPMTLALGMALGMSISAQAADALLIRAKQLVDAKQPDKAYAILAPLQSERAGEAEYDYVLGLAALDSGHAAESVFAFERFLTLHPDNGPARLELARAYYVMGDTKASLQEFKTVKREPVPPQASQAIQDYLSAINKIVADNEATRYRGYVEARIGHDSNANSATSLNQVAIPAFGGAIATLDPDSTKTGDDFAALGAGISVRHPYSAQWALNANADIRQRGYRDVDQYNLGALDAALGLTRTSGVDQFTGAVQYQKLNLDHSSYRQTYGALGQWQHNIDDQRQATLYGQLMRLDYDTQSVRNANRYIVGAAYSQVFDAKYLPIIYGGAYIGAEQPLASGVANLKNDFVGMRIGGQLSLSTRMAVSANASFEDRHYGGEEPGFLKRRTDLQTDLSLALSYIPTRDWLIRPEISYTRNDSNIPFNDFSRLQYLVTVRRNFN